MEPETKVEGKCRHYTSGRGKDGKYRRQENKIPAHVHRKVQRHLGHQLFFSFAGHQHRLYRQCVWPYAPAVTFIARPKAVSSAGVEYPEHSVHQMDFPIIRIFWRGKEFIELDAC